MKTQKEILFSAEDVKLSEEGSIQWIKYCIGFLLGGFFSVYGLVFFSSNKKSKSFRRGLIHGCILSCFLLLSFSLQLIFYKRYERVTLRHNKYLRNKYYHPHLRKIKNFWEFITLQKAHFKHKAHKKKKRGVL